MKHGSWGMILKCLELLAIIGKLPPPLFIQKRNYLLNYTYKNGVGVTEKYFKVNSYANGLCKVNKIEINKRLLTSLAKKCVLAEAMNHKVRIDMMLN